MRIGRDDEGDAFNDLHSGKGFDFFGIVGQQAQAGDPKMLQDEFDHFIRPFIRGKAQLMVGGDGIEPLILKGVGIDFVEQADVATLLSMVDDHATFRSDLLQ